MSSETETVAAGIVMEFPVSDETAGTSSFSSPIRVPGRIRKRLLAEFKTPCTAAEIEAKLRHADLRRQQFYEKLSSKARPKPRSPSQSSSHEEDLGQRLEAKLQAAQQKRLSILAKARMRLARLDELRQAAKTGVEIRYEREREMLGSRMESRVQQAEANRMLILKAYSQRRAKLKERSSQSLLRRMARESKYKERVRAAIYQKRAAAEKKRLGLLEAEKKRACARVLQVRRVAKFVSHQREVERRRMSDQLEDRLQRAKRQRAEYLRQRGRLHNSVPIRMHKEADLLSRKLARCWRQFHKQRRTTFDLAKAFVTLKISESSVRKMPFEQLALLIESTATLQTVKALLERLECRLKISRAIGTGNNQTSNLDHIDHLLKRVASPKRRPNLRTPMKCKEARKVGPSREAGRRAAKMSRYQVRVVLCAYMILGHPDAVFSGQGEHEIALAKSAEEFVRQFEILIKIISEGPIQSSDEESDSLQLKRWSFHCHLDAFDKAWCSYLNCFVMWKVKDAKSLEDDLVRAACQLELSMIQKCKMTADGDNDTSLTHDLKAIQKQVTEDQKLLREKVQHLGGDAGIERMESALSETRSKYFEARENGSPVGSPITGFLSPSPSSSPAVPTFVPSVDSRDSPVEVIEKPNSVVRSLFKEETDPPKGIHSYAPSSSNLGGPFGSSVEKQQQQITENELIVNEFVHKHCGFVDSSSNNYEEQDVVKAKIRETMEKAFWGGIMESVEQDEPNYYRVIQLVREVRDGICEMAPQSWKEEITEAIDLEILAQLLNYGNLDIAYLGKILEFALSTLQKLSSSANDDEMKANDQKLLKELAEICLVRDESNKSHVIAMIKGLRFVLEQIQALKREISKARIRLMEPLLKGPAGLDYLRKAFASRHGPPSDAHTSLPLTLRWLSSVWACKDQEWEEHMSSLSALMRHESSSSALLPSTTLRTGGSFLVKTSGSHIISSPRASGATSSTGNEQPECKGERLDLLVRLGLLKLVSGISGLTQETLPETFVLNLVRLRAVQAQFQKIIVVSTSILICRQTLLSERVVTSPAEMDNIVSKCTERLLEFLDRIEDAGIEEIVEVMSSVSNDNDKAVVDSEKLQLRKAVMARMLAKSLQAGDAVFEKVSHAVYTAARGVVLGGSGPNGKKLGDMALRHIGAVSLTESVVEAAEVLVVAATVSVSVHGQWYINLTDNM